MAGVQGVVLRLYREVGWRLGERDQPQSQCQDSQEEVAFVLVHRVGAPQGAPHFSLQRMTTYGVWRLNLRLIWITGKRWQRAATPFSPYESEGQRFDFSRAHLFWLPGEIYG